MNDAWFQSTPYHVQVSFVIHNNFRVVYKIPEQHYQKYPKICQIKKAIWQKKLGAIFSGNAVLGSLTYTYRDFKFRPVRRTHGDRVTKVRPNYKFRTRSYLLFWSRSVQSRFWGFIGLLEKITWLRPSHNITYWLCLEFQNSASRGIRKFVKSPNLEAPIAIY